MTYIRESVTVESTQAGRSLSRLLRKGAGNPEDRLQLHVDLSRARGIPSRKVAGFLPLESGRAEPVAWVEHLIDGRWSVRLESLRATKAGVRESLDIVVTNDGVTILEEMDIEHPSAKMIVEENLADHIDMNFGCPVPKVTKRGGGSAIPYKRKLFAKIVAAAVRAIAESGHHSFLNVFKRMGPGNRAPLSWRGASVCLSAIPAPDGTLGPLPRRETYRTTVIALPKRIVA